MGAINIDKPTTLADAMAGLNYIDPNMDRSDWARIAMALKSGFGDDAFGIWDDWSRNGDTYSPEASRSTWRSISSSGGISIASLFKYAKEGGYHPSGNNPPPKSIPKKQAPKPVNCTGIYAKKLWLKAIWGNISTHPYAQAKGIDWDAGAKRGIASGRVVGRNADCIVVPIRDLQTDKAVAVQCINAGGEKQTFGSISGHGFICGNTLDKSMPWYVVEGWATGISMVFHHSNGNACCGVAFGKGNMGTVADVMNDIYQPREIKIAEERD